MNHNACMVEIEKEFSWVQDHLQFCCLFFFGSVGLAKYGRSSEQQVEDDLRE